jgi:hypothetical protein
MRNAIPSGDRLISNLRLRTALPTCVEPAMLHLTYKSEFLQLDLLTGDTCKMWRTDAEFA